MTSELQTLYCYCHFSNHWQWHDLTLNTAIIVGRDRNAVSTQEAAVHYEHFGDWTDPRMAHTITCIQVRADDSASPLTTSYTFTSISERNTHTFPHTFGLARIMPETTVYTHTNPQLLLNISITWQRDITYLKDLTYTVLSYNMLWKQSPQAKMSRISSYYQRQKMQAGWILLSAVANN